MLVMHSVRNDRMKGIEVSLFHDKGMFTQTRTCPFRFGTIFAYHLTEAEVDVSTFKTVL